MPASKSHRNGSTQSPESGEAVIDESAAGDTAPALPAVVEQTGTALAIPEDGFAEAVSFSAVNLRINRSKGQFWLEGEDQPRDSVKLIPRGIHKAQMYFGLPYKQGQPHEPSCQSPDGRHAYGWINTDNQVDAPRKCLGCPRKGFGQGSCTDLMVMLAFDVERGTPVMTRFQNAELNPRKGVLTLAVNRFRSLGLKPFETLLTLRFVDTDAAYKALQIDVEKAESNDLEYIQQLMHVCWAAYEESRSYEIQELMERF